MNKPVQLFFKGTWPLLGIRSYPGRHKASKYFSPFITASLKPFFSLFHICLDPCFNVKCNFGARCAVLGGKGSCVCDHKCPAVYRPVCGDNGATYGNLCVLRVTSCVKQMNITKAYNGTCSKYNQIKNTQTLHTSSSGLLKGVDKDACQNTHIIYIYN